MTKFIKNIMQVAACVGLWVSACGTACAATLHFGPCEGQLSEKGYGKTGKGTISAAVVIPKEQLAQYAGARIKGIRIGLKTVDGMTNLRGWVRASLTSANAYSTKVVAPAEGWNDLQMTAAGTVSGSEDIAIGYSFEQETTVRCMSVAGAAVKNGYWIAKNGEWTDKSDGSTGSLSIELVIEGDNVPETNIGIVSSSFDKITKRGDIFNAWFVVQNRTNTTVGSYRYTCKIAGNAVAEATVSKQLQSFQRDTVRLAVQSDIVSKAVKIPVNVEVTADGDGYAPDNTATLYMSTYDESNNQYWHNVLLEEFSTEQCGNCPRAINTIEQCMEQGYDKNVIQVTHHSGYNYDFLSTPDDKTLLWFYGANGSFAPAAMLDRLDDVRLKQLLGGKEGTPVMSVGYADTFAPALKYATEKSAFVSVVPTAVYDPSSRKLDITVNVEKDEVFDAQCAAPRLTVYIVQDSILHHSQAGYSSDTFRHRHVYRCSVTPLFGDEIEWTGNKAQMKYSYTLPEAIESTLHLDKDYDKNVPLVARDVEVVAFVGNYNADDRCDCTVFNTGRYSLKQDLPASVGVVDADKRVVATEYYSLDGSLTAGKPSAGICIQLTRYADGTESVVKMMR